MIIFLFRHPQAQCSPEGCDVSAGHSNKVAGHLDSEVTVYLYFRLVQVNGWEACLWLLGQVIQT